MAVTPESRLCRWDLAISSPNLGKGQQLEVSLVQNSDPIAILMYILMYLSLFTSTLGSSSLIPQLLRATGMELHRAILVGNFQVWK